jgi:hypothetical protein
MLEWSCSQENNGNNEIFIAECLKSCILSLEAQDGGNQMVAEPIPNAPETFEEPVKGEKAERERSRIEFPYYSLDESIKIAKGVFDLGSSCQIDQLAGHLGQSATGGGFRVKLMAARTFGLITYTQGNVSLTELGSQIVDPDHEREARAQSFLKVPLYSAIYEQNKGKILPGNVGLEGAMVNLGVAAKQKDKARQAFQRSAKEAGFFSYGATKLVYPVFGQERAGKPSDPLNSPPPPPARDGNNGGGSGNGGNGGELDPLIQGLLNKLPDSSKPWTLEGRKKWLQLALGILDVMYTGAEEGKILTITVEDDNYSAK